MDNNQTNQNNGTNKPRHSTEPQQTVQDIPLKNKILLTIIGLLAIAFFIWTGINLKGASVINQGVPAKVQTSPQTNTNP